MTLEGWCVIAVRKHCSHVSMVSNVADLELARMHANKIKEDGGKVLAICKEADLAKLVPLLTLCRELDAELDGAKIGKAAAEIMNAIRRLLS